MQRYMPVAWAGGKAECHKDDRGEYVLHSDAQSRIAKLEAERDKWRNECLAANESERKLFQRQAELEAEVARLTAIQTIDGWDAARWKHEYDVQLYLAKSAWNDAIDAAAAKSKEGWNAGYDPTPHILSLRR